MQQVEEVAVSLQIYGIKYLPPFQMPLQVALRKGASTFQAIARRVRQRIEIDWRLAMHLLNCVTCGPRNLAII
jgi:hypothetical protein